MDTPDTPPADGTDLPLYHTLPMPKPGPRPLWCNEPACLCLTEKFPDRPGLYRCPKCRKVYPEKDEVLTADNWPEGLGGLRQAERKAAQKAAEAATPKQGKFKLKF